jgi:hypothetical protein
MHKLTRAVVLTGVAVATGVTMAAGPAAASTGTSSAPKADSGKSVAKQQQGWRRDRIFDYYRSPRACHSVGRAGVWRDRWESYRCVPVGGFHRGGWALRVFYGWGPGGPGGPGHGPGGPGFPGGTGHGHGPGGHGPGGFDGPGGWKKGR